VSEADLFVVCKNCGSEVSPYVTECPYCGQRLRKRAPKIDRGEPEEPPRRRRGRPKAPKLPKLRPDEIPGIAPETRPWMTGALVVAALVVTILLATDELTEYELGAIVIPIDGDWWRIGAYAFVHDNAGTEFVALVALGIFGTHLERRFGSVSLLVIFLACAAAGGALTDALEIYPAIGASGPALGLLLCWLVDDRLAMRRGDDRGNDLLGVAVIGAVLALIPLADEEVSWAASLGSAGAGAVVGAIISPFRR
jgi:membrane associated rhomboid family serine protease